MKYTRRFFDQFEWYHKPVSPIEETLMLAKHMNTSINLFSQRLGLKFPKETWKVIEGYLYFSSEYWRLFLQIDFLFLPFRFLKELRVAKTRWLEKVLPAYQKQIDKVSEIDYGKLDIRDKLSLLKELADLESHFLAESIYVAMFCASIEILLKFFYALSVKKAKPGDYYELLLGFPDKGLEMDSKLWKITQVKNGDKRDKEIDEWIEKYGYRVQDKDLIFPTLGEKRNLIESYVQLYQNIPDPGLKRQFSEEKRKAREKLVERNIWNFPYLKKIVWRIIKLAQEYAKIRNSRPFYYQGNKYLRRTLVTIAKELNFFDEVNDIFFLRFSELEEIAEGRLPKTTILKSVDDRKFDYYRKMDKKPKFEIIYDKIN
jgi:hypothetical protein